MSYGRALGILAGISLLWGSLWLLGPTLAGATQPFAAGALLFGVAACVLFSIAWARKQPSAPVGASVRLGLALLAGPQALLVLAGQHGIGGWTPLLYSLLPLLLALPEGTWTPAMAAAPACVLVLLNGAVPFAPEKLLWTPLALFAVILQAWALRFVFERCRGSAVSSLLSGACAAGVCGIMTLLFERTRRFTLSGAGLAAVAVAGVLGTAVPYAGLLAILTQGALTPAQAAAGQWLQIVLAAGESAALVRAHPSSSALLSAAALLACFWSVLRQIKSKTTPENMVFRANP